MADASVAAAVAVFRPRRLLLEFIRCAVIWRMEVGARYLDLVLQFRRLAPSLVDSYVGPAELAAQVTARPLPSHAEVGQNARHLLENVEQHEPDRARADWLGAQLRGIETACRWLAGGPAGYRELVERCHGVQVSEVDESQFEQAHQLMAQALPGSGPLRERFARWRARQLVSGAALVEGLQALTAEFRRRCRERWELPDAEEVVFELTRGRPWAAYHDYQGGGRSVVQVNDEQPVMAWRMGELIAHEAYPGHHTETVCKASALAVDRGRTEVGVWVYTTPQALIAEGIAMLAPEILLGEEIEEIAAACLRPLGIDYDTHVSAAARRAQELLLPLRAHLALLLHDGRIDRDGTRAYARRWLLDDDTYVDRVAANLCEQPWPPYTSCYPEGLSLCRSFVGGDPQKFGFLLRQQVTPHALKP